MKYLNKLKIKVIFLKQDKIYAEDAIIDTGSSITIVPPEISDYLKFGLDKENPTIKIVTGSGILEIPRKITSIMKINDLVFTNFPVGIHELPREVETKVLIGMDIINKIKLIVDGKNKEFEIIG